jgi:hypothetical protein
MSDEIQNEVAAEPASEQVATAAPETEIIAPETEQPNEQQSKTFTQEELDAIVGKRLAREQRKWEREQSRKAPPVSELPPVDQFESVDAYAEALAERKAEELLTRR